MTACHQRRLHFPLKSFAYSANLIFLLIGCASTKPNAPDPSTSMVAIIDGSPLSLTEFKTQYDRTSVLESETPSDTIAAYKDFLERYVDFRLKVLEARSAGYHELSDLKSEIQGYRSQLARPRLLDREVKEPLIRELHARRLEMVEASHVLITVSQNAVPEDTLAAYSRLSAIGDSVAMGMDFGTLAFRHSDDPSSRGTPGSPGYRGYLGFFGGGRMVDEFEDAAYTTPLGELSEIFRTQFGYHILMVHSRKSLPGDIRIAHIMVQPKGTTAADTLAAISRIDSVLTKLSEGEDFGELARQYSDDRASAGRGGELQRVAFDSGLPAVLRDAAYDLQVNAYSDVVKSPFGYHIVRLLERYEPETYEEAYSRLQSQISQLPRAQKAEQAFARRKRIEFEGRVDTLRVESWLANLKPDSLVKLLSGGGFEESELSAPIAWIRDSTYTVSQFTTDFRHGRISGNLNPLQRIWDGLDQFLNARALDYEIARLEERDEDFARTMQNFRDGLILFRLMEDSVWTAAAIDTVALRSLHATRVSSYTFSDRTKVISISSPSDSLLNDISLLIQAGDTVADAIGSAYSDSLNVIRVDTTLIEGVTNSVFDTIMDNSKGAVTSAIPYNNGYIVLYHDGVDPSRDKTFEEARAQVVNEYQVILEKRLIERLRKKYNVTLYPDRLQALVASGKAKNE